MQKKSALRIAALPILSVMALALAIGAFSGNNAAAAYAFAKEGTEDGGETGGGEGETTPETESMPETETTPETEAMPEPECSCEGRCGRHEQDRDCPVCSADYEKCAYKEPCVKITIAVPSGWRMGGSSVKVKFSVEDVLDTGNLVVKSVKARVGQNGSYQDVSEDMCMEISENCSVYVLVTDAKGRNYERSRPVRCFDTAKPTLNAAVSEGLLTIQAADSDSGVKAVYVNGHEFSDMTNGTLNIRLSQFDAGYEHFAISAMDAAGNMSDIYKMKNPYYKDPQSGDDSNPAKQLPQSAGPTKPSSAAASVTDHTKTDSNGNAIIPASAEEKKKAGSSKAAAEADKTGAESVDGGNMSLGKEFYTIEAASGKVFYLIISRDGEEEKAYFLTEIMENDLLNVTTDNSETLPRNSAALEPQKPLADGALLNSSPTSGGDTHKAAAEGGQNETADAPDNAGEGETGAEGTEAAEPQGAAAGSPLAGYGIMGILGAAVIGAAYYFKIARKKQDGDFVEDEDEDEDDGGYEESGESENESDFFDDLEDEGTEPEEDCAEGTDGGGEYEY